MNYCSPAKGSVVVCAAGGVLVISWPWLAVGAVAVVGAALVLRALFRRKKNAGE